MSLYQGNAQIGGQGRPGDAGKSAYEAAKEGGYTGTEAEFNEAMKLTPPHLSDRGNPHGVTAEQIGAAAANHTHTAGQISGLPTSLPASDVYPWAKQPNKPAYTAGEVGAAPSGHTHDDRYYTEAEVNNLLSAIKTRLTKLEGSVDMAKLVYSTAGMVGSNSFTKTYNAAFVRVKVSHGEYASSNAGGYLGMAYVDVPKGGDGRLGGVAMDMYIRYDSNGELHIEGYQNGSSKANYEYVHIEFYNY